MQSQCLNGFDRMDRIREHRSKPTVGSIGFSEDRLKDAYGRMDMENHPWARHASKEILVIARKR